ncbi:MAG: flagellar basal-body rod protein FlgF [Nitrospinae bacterium]|nr:flagellar basal-body rod protein FlgF [Nitrospinota bacterium]
MHSGMYVAATGFLASERRLETITNNLANINTPGYKADRLVFESYLSKAGASEPTAATRSEGTRPSDFVVPSEQYTDQAQGPMKSTGNPLDLAIEGEGFFAVMTANGERYTRAGNFQVGPNGELVTANGDVALDDMDRPIIVNDGVVTVDQSGQIWVEKESATGQNSDVPMEMSASGRSAGKLKIVEFSKPLELTKEGNGLYRAEDPGAALKAENARVSQGTLEQSNVNMIMEMTQLIQNQRLAETYQKLITENDAMTGQMISQVGR